jgi:hypothetical protein
MSKRLKIYSSFEEQEADQIAYQLSISPEQRIKEAVELIKRVYNYQPGRKARRKFRIVTSG